MSDNTTNTTNVSHNESVKAFIEKVRALRQEIPNLIPPSSKDERKRLTPAGNVSPQFVELAAAAVENTPVLALSPGARIRTWSAT